MESDHEHEDRKDAPAERRPTPTRPWLVQRWALSTRAAVLILFGVMAAMALFAGALVVLFSPPWAQQGTTEDAEPSQTTVEPEVAAAIEAALPGWEIMTEPDDLEPLALSDQPVWGSEHQTPLQVISEVTFLDDAAVLVGGYVDQPEDRLQVVEAATGTPLWGLSRDDELRGIGGWWPAAVRPVVVDHGDGRTAVLVDYRCRHSGCPHGDDDDDDLVEYGVAALAPDTGDVLWSSMIGEGHLTESLVALVADGGTAVVAKLSSSSCPVPGNVSAVGLDTSNGQTLWTADGLRPVDVADDTVLTQAEAPHEGPSCTQPAQPGVVALDAATGEVRWDLRERFGWSQPLLTAGDVALVEVGESSDSAHETLVLDLADGSEVASFGTEVDADDCASDGRSLIACSVSLPPYEGVLATFDVEHRSGGARLTDEAISLVDNVALGRVFGPHGLSDGHVSVDRSVQIVDGELPGALLAASDEYALFVCEDAACSGGLVGDPPYPHYLAYRMDQ